LHLISYIYVVCNELGLWGKENNWLNFIFLLISLFPLEIVLEDADSFLIPQGYVKLHIPNLSLSRLQCKGNNSIISCQELRCITVNSFICCEVIQQHFKRYSYQNWNQSLLAMASPPVALLYNKYV
jgi:hypothetical protein